MADFSRGSQDWASRARNPANPEGLRQENERLATAQTRWDTGQTKLRPWGVPENSMLETARSWYTGANSQAGDNGWNNDFYKVAYEQYDQWQRKAMEPDQFGNPRPSTFFGWLDPVQNPRATGVATWGADPFDEEAKRTGALRFGDVFDGGRKVANLYDDYEGDPATADVMVGEFLFSREEKSRMFASPDRAALYREEVEKRRRENTERSLYAKTAEDYRDNVARREEELKAGAGNDTTILGAAIAGGAAGAGAGAVLTSWLGPGALVGGAIGGAIGFGAGLLGGILNQDQLVEMRARSGAKAEIANSYYGDDLGWLQKKGVWLENYSDLGMRFLNPFSNIHQGLVDAKLGKVGDMTSEFYAVDENGERRISGWMKGGDILATLADGVLQFASPIGKWMYLGGMGANVAGSFGQLTTGAVFNDARGTYDELEGWQEWAGASGSFAIDAAQMGMAGAFTRAARGSRAAFTGTTDATASLGARGILGAEDAAGPVARALDRAWTRKGGEELGTAVTVNGRRFIRDTEGTVLSVRPTLEAIAPSEWLRWIPTSYNARRLARIDGGEMTRDHLLNSALTLTGHSQFRDAVIMGYSEGGEEFFQSWLDPLATGDRATWGQSFEAFLYGAAGGVGMGLGPTNRAASSKQVMEARAYTQFVTRTGYQPDQREWTELTKGWKPKDFERMAKTTDRENKQTNDMLAQLADLERQDRANFSSIGFAKLEDIQGAQFEKLQKKAIEEGNGSLVVMGRTSEYLVSPVGTVEKAKHQPNAGLMSMRELVTQIGLINQGLQAQLDKALEEMAEARTALDRAAPEDRARNQAVLDDASSRAGDLQNQQRFSRMIDGIVGSAFEAFNGLDDPKDMEDAIEALNARLRKAYDGRWEDGKGNRLPPEEQRLVRRAVELKLGRHPFMDRGSFAVVMPQVSIELTKLNAHGAVYLPQGMLKALGADHDGDTMVPQHTTYLSDADRERFYRGDQYVRLAIDEKTKKRVVELVIDPPDGEWAFILSFKDASRDPNSLAAGAVNSRLEKLGTSLLTYSQKYGGPIPHIAMEQAIEDFKNAVKSGSVSARENLVKKLYEIDFEGMRGFDNPYGVSSVQWIWDKVNATWDMLQKDLANMRATTSQDVIISKQREAVETQIRSEIARQDTMTASATLGMLANSPVRSAQFAHYSMLFSSLTQVPEGAAGTLTTQQQLELTELFRRLGSNESMSEKEKVMARGSIERRVNLWLTDMANMVTDTTMSVPEIKLMLANMSVPSVSKVTGKVNEYVVDEGSITMGQLLLRRSLDIEAERFDAAPPDSAEAKKIRRLRRLTERDKDPSKHSYTASLAVAEIFADIPLHQLVGKASVYIAPQITLGQMSQMLRGMHPLERRQMLSRLKERSPAYIKAEGAPKDPPWSFSVLTATEPQISAYAMLVDTLQVVADTYIPMLRERDSTVHSNFIKGLSGLHDMIDAHRMKHGARLGKGVSEIDDMRVLRDMLKDQRLAKEIAEIIPDAAALGVFQRHEDGSVTESKWLMKALVNRNVEQAAARYYFHTKIAGFNVLGGTVQLDEVDENEEQQLGDVRGSIDPGKIKSRFQQVIWHLASQRDQIELLRFLRAMSQADSIETMFQLINTEPAWRNNQEELLPWYDDVALFEPNPNDTWNSALDGATQREKIANWGTRLQTMGSVALEVQQNYLSNKLSLEAMHEWVTSGFKIDRDCGAELFGLLGRAIKNRQMFPDTIGQVARSQLIELLQLGIAPMQNKGVAPAQAAPFGEPLITLDSFGFSDGLRQEMAAITSEDVEDVRLNLTLLVQEPVRIMFEDGTYTVFDISTPEKALEMLRDPQLHDLAWAILAPSVRDVNNLNKSQTYLDTDSKGNLASMLREQTFKHLFSDQSSFGKQLEQAHRYIGNIEGYVRNKAKDTTDETIRDRAFFPIQNLIHEFVLIYTHTNDGRDGDKERSPQQLRDQLIIDVANAIKVVASVDPLLRGDLRDVVTKAMLDRVDPSGNRLKKWGVGNTIDEELIKLEQHRKDQDAANEIRTDFLNRITNETDPTRREGLLEEFKSWRAEWARTKRTFGYPESTYANALSALDMFEVTNADPSADTLSKTAIMLFLGKQERIAKLDQKGKIKIGDVKVDLQNLYDRAHRQIYTDPRDLNSEKFTLEEWKVLGSWAAQIYMQEITGRSSSSVPASGQLLGDDGEQIRRYFDHSLSYPLDILLDPLVLEAADTLAQDNIYFARHDVKKASKVLLSGLFNENKIGMWTEVLVDESMKARQILKNSPVGAAVAQEGDDPKELSDYVAAGKVTWDLPQSEHFTTVKMFGSGMTRPDIPPAKYIQLQNHFVSGIRLISTDPSIPTPDIPLQAIFLNSTMRNETSDVTREVGTPDPNDPNKLLLRVLDLEEMGTHIERMLKVHGLKDYALEIDVVDINKKPYRREWANNIFFDGSGREIVGGSSMGAVACLFFGLNALNKIGQQNPLDMAAKKGMGFRAFIRSKFSTVEQMEQPNTPVVDMMVEKAIHVLGRSYPGRDGFEAVSRLDTASIHKLVRMRHVIVGYEKDTQGKRIKRVMWPDEYIPLEVAGNAPTLEDMKVIPLSDSVAQTLWSGGRSIKGVKGTRGSLGGQPLFNIQDYDVFPLLTNEYLERLGLERLGQEADLGNSRLAQVTVPPRAVATLERGAPLAPLQSRMLTQWRGEKQKVTTRRMNRRKVGKGNFDIDRIQSANITRIIELLQLETQVAAMQKLGIPAQGLVDLAALQTSRSISTKLRKSMDNENAMVWVYRHDQEGQLTDGLIGRADVSNGFSGFDKMGPVYGDTIVLDLTEILLAEGGSYEAAAAEARGLIKEFSKRGLTLALEVSGGQQDLLAAVTESLHDGSLNYTSVSNSNHFFMPDMGESAYNAAQRALASTLLETDQVMAKNVTLRIVSDSVSTSLHESSEHVDFEHDKSIHTLSHVLLPYTMVGGTSASRHNPFAFNVPQKGTGQADQMTRVTTELLGLLNETEGRAYLKALLGDDGSYPKYREHLDAKGNIKTIEYGVLEVDEALDRLRRTLEAGAFPLDVGQELMWGSIIPTVSGDGSIHLARIGFNQPRRKDLRKQGEVRYKDRMLKITSATNKLDRSQTVPPPFKVSELRTDHKGFSVIGTYQPGAMAKMVSEGIGLKSGYAWMPKGYRFPDAVIGAEGAIGKRVTRIMGATSVIGKESRGGIANRFRDAILVSGINFEDDMIEFLFQIDPKTLSAEDRAKYWDQTEQALKKWADYPHKYTATELSRLVDMDAGILTLTATMDAITKDVMSAARLPYKGLAIPQFGVQQTVNQRLGTLILATLAAPGVRLEHVIGTAGVTTVTNENSLVRRMPSLLTQALNDPTFPELREEIIGRLNRNMPKDANGRYVYWFDNELKFHAVMQQEYTDANKQIQTRPEEIVGYLQAHVPIAADENAIRLVHSAITSGGPESKHIADTVAATHGGRIATKTRKNAKLPTSLDELYGENLIERFEEEEDEPSQHSYLRMLTRVRAGTADYCPWQKRVPMELVHLQRGDAWVRAYTYLGERSKKTGWSKAEIIEAERLASDFCKALNLFDDRAINEVEYLARQLLGLPGPLKDQKDYNERLTFDLFRTAVTYMKRNIDSGMHPLDGGRVPLEHDAFWRRVHAANMEITDPTRQWRPLANGGKVKEYADDTYDSWVKVLHGQMRSSHASFDSRFRTALDGFMHTYQGASADFITVPISTDAAVAAKLLDKDTNEPFMSVDLGLNSVLREPIVLDGQYATYDALMGKGTVTSRDTVEETPADEIAQLIKNMDEWRKEKGLAKQKDLSIKEYAKLGAAYQESQRQSTNAMRNLVNLSVTVRLFNPALYFSAMFEVPFRAALTNISNVMAGTSTGATGVAAAATAGQAQKALTKMLGERVAGVDLTPAFTTDDIARIRQLDGSMGVSNKFLGLVYGELTYQQVAVQGKGKLGEFLERTATGAARATADPWWGKHVSNLARRYNEAALEYLKMTDSIITVEQYAWQMMNDPGWLEKNAPAAHRVALNAVLQARGAKATMFSKSVMKPIESMSASGNIAVSYAGLALKLPFLFTRFNGNMMMTLSGTSGFDQALAMFFDGRQRPHFIQRMLAKAKKEPWTADPKDVWDNSDVIESLDLSRAFVTGAITHTGLMAAAMLAGGFGLGGEDEEERKRRRMAEYLNTPYYYDPRKASTDFRWKDAIFLDNVPILNMMLKDETGHSAVVPHWIIKQFMDPVLGMMRFFETGNIAEIKHGFSEAASVLPNSIMRLWQEANMTADLLAQAADDDALTAEALEAKRSLLTNIVFVYEKALFENAFINGLYQARDQFDRNPWAIQMTEDNGDITREEGSVQPLQTDASQQYLKGTGDEAQVKVGYATRKGPDALLHQYTEGNATAALVMSIMPWLQGEDSTYLRGNMVTKRQRVQVAETEQAQLEALVFSAYLGRGGQDFLTKEEIIRSIKNREEAADRRWEQSAVEAEADAQYSSLSERPLTIFDNGGKEVMTQDGVGGVFRSLWDGVITLDNPAIQGFNASKEMRDALAEEWTTELVQEGVDLGLSEESANYRMRRIWYGDSTNPDAPGLRELLYSKLIPDKPYVEYDQLNVTYTLGPDGKPWATPFSRQNVLQVLGLPIPHGMAPTIPGVTKLDARGNVVDLIRGTNTGLAGIQPRPIAPIEPDDEPMKKSEAKTYIPGGGGSGWRRFPRSGGGYGGSSYGPNFQRMLPLPSGTGARMDGLQMINTSNPMIRRSDVRRQRISSERGRLKQWQ